MEDKERIKLLNEFINDTSIVKGAEIEVYISDLSRSMTPKHNQGMKYEDCNFIDTLITGAESFLFWCSRSGYEVKKRRDK